MALKQENKWWILRLLTCATILLMPTVEGSSCQEDYEKFLEAKQLGSDDKELWALKS